MKKTLCFAAFSAGAVLAGGGVASAQEAPPPSGQSPARSHTVEAGESLSKISQAELGTPHRWVEIFVLNRDTVTDPDLIEIGQVLEIPSAPVAVPAHLLASLAPAPAPVPEPSLQSAATAGQGATLTDAVRAKMGAGGNLAAIRACESDGDYGAVSSDGLYRGAYQFDRPTWESVGGNGDPAAASPAEQDARAAQLLSERGSNPWPNCG
ncbi:MAG: transglycosylase family protein [Acidimicrobiales bacterium]